MDIGADPVPAYQLRRYGWSAGLRLSILTDFEEFAVYDCTIRPRQNDKASYARVMIFNYREYPDRWREFGISSLAKRFGPVVSTSMPPPSENAALRKSMPNF